MNFDVQKMDWNKMQDLVPVVVQDDTSQQILMLGYMNQAALLQTLESKIVTFYSRSKKALWVKGETSGNKLALKNITVDCDNDALLVRAKPLGPTCHLGTTSCFKENEQQVPILFRLEKIIQSRIQEGNAKSYVVQLFKSGMQRMAQKVGEEGVEVALAAVLEDKNALCNEVADLLFHVLVLLRAKDIAFSEILNVLESRNRVL